MEFNICPFKYSDWSLISRTIMLFSEGRIAYRLSHVIVFINIHQLILWTLSIDYAIKLIFNIQKNKNMI